MKNNFSGIALSYNTAFLTNWKNALQLTAFRKQAFFTFLVVLFMAAFIHHFFGYIQARNGYVINDFVLNHFAPRDVSGYIFMLMYTVISIALVNIAQRPFLFLKGLQAYCLLVFMRIFFLYIIPLNPAETIIPLRDPVVDYFFYNETVITKDLFFSGHISTLFLLFLFIPGKRLKLFFVLVTLLVSALLLMQHSHYTIDIIAAPFFSWISYKLSGMITVREKPVISNLFFV
jgi:hypothetical protein